MKDLGEASYILKMKNYTDESKRLFELSQSTYIDIILKWFSMENFKKGYLPIGHEIFFSKNYLIIPQEREHISKISHASAVGFIMSS